MTLRMRDQSYPRRRTTQPQPNAFTSRSAQRPVEFQAGAPLSLAQIAAPRNLLAALDQLARRGGPAPGPDGVRYRDVSRTELATRLESYSQDILDGSYRPGPARRKNVRKPDGGTRPLAIRSIFDRAVSKAVLHALVNYLDVTMAPGSMGFRPRRGVLNLLAELELAIQQGNYVIVHVDIRKAFDNVPLARTIQAFRQHVTDEHVMWLVETVLRGNAGACRQVGIDQGDPLSSLALNVLLTAVLDRPLTAACPGTPHWRYADNIVIACQSETEAHRTRQMVQQLLAEAQLALKDEHGLADLRRQGARTRILGHEISLGPDGRPCYRISRESWHHLAVQLRDAQRKPDPQGLATAIVLGWLAEYGPAYECAESQAIAEDVYRTAAREGYRELGPTDRLLEVMDRAHRQWISIREDTTRRAQRIQQRDIERISVSSEANALRASGSDESPF